MATTNYAECQNAFHFTMEYNDPLSKIRVGRTYFLTNNMMEDHLTRPIQDEFEKVIGHEIYYDKSSYYEDER